MKQDAFFFKLKHEENGAHHSLKNYNAAIVQYFDMVIVKLAFSTLPQKEEGVKNVCRKNKKVPSFFFH